MADATEQATIPTPEQVRPDRVSIWGRDPNGVLRPLALNTSGEIEMTAEITASMQPGSTVTSTATRMTDTSTYAINDAWSNDTAAPTTGGYTLTGMARASGGSGLIDDITIISSNDPAAPLQGELWIFDSAVTAINDNAAFALSDADAIKLVTVVPFSLVTTVAGSGTNSVAVLPLYGIGYTCVGSANLRYLVKVKNAYVPANAEALTIRAKIRYTT